jgi:NAD-dependent SIR2 family protein deacetylase
LSTWYATFLVTSKCIARFTNSADRLKRVYEDLHAMVKDKDYFVLTSNVDGMFPKNGFDENKMYTPQGDFKYMQCYKPCTQQVWESKAFIEKFLPSINPDTQVQLLPMPDDS